VLLALALCAITLGGVLASRDEAASQPRATGSPPVRLLGIRGSSRVRSGPKALALVRLDPATFRARPGRRVLLGDRQFAWSFSPNRSRVVLADATLFGWLRFVDVARMRALGDLRVNAGGWVRATAWLSEDRLVAVAEYEQETTLVLVDAARRAVVSRTPLPGSFERLERSADGIVLLLGSRSGIAPAVVAVVDRAGAVRTTQLDRIRIGTEPIDHSTLTVVRSAHAGLAVDAAAGRAYVVGAAAPVAAVDLTTLAVTYHELSRPVSLLGRLHDWLEPSAAAKGAPDGPVREAAWLGDGVLAVWGYDDHGLAGADGPRWRQTAAGLSLVDTRTWSVRTVDPTISEARPLEGGILGWSMLWDSDTRRNVGSGVRLYDASGGRRFHLFGERPVPNAVPAGNRALVAFLTSASSYAVVDLVHGRVLRTERSAAPPVLLVG
jgi:hypothetical protein